jgi:HSP20 family molecular chaperone IbpA
MKFVPTSRNNNGLSLFDDNFFNDFFDLPVMPFRRDFGLMKTDIKEKDGNYLLDIDLPGFDKEDIKIRLENEYLTVWASKEEKKEEKGQNGEYIRQERYTGSCSRSFYVGNVKEENIKANFRNGTLSLTVPKINEPIKEEKKYISID